MIQVLNFFVFSFAILFGFEAPVISETTNVTINQKEQTISLDYNRLKTFEKLKEQALPIIDSVNIKTKLHPSITGLKLLSKTEIKSGQNKSISIKIRYSSKQALLDHFKINLNDTTIFVHPCEEILINKKDTLRNVDMKFEFLKFNSSNNIIDIEFKHLHGNECEGFKNTIDF